MGIVWFLGAVVCLLVTHLGSSPRAPALLWTAPWVISAVSLSFEVSRNAERDMMVVSSIFMILFYFSPRALGLFFIFEAAGLPLLLSIFLLGRQPQKIEAAKYILFYIAFTALPLLYAVAAAHLTATQLFSALGLLSVVPFLAKIPAYLLHAWLPKAHVEARTPGRMVLAGRVIKLGSFGILNWCVRPGGRSLGCAIVGLGVVLVASALLRGADIKTLVAYSRVLHMAVGIVAWVCSSVRGRYGVLLSNVAHTILRPIMFLGVSVFYSTQGNRDRSTILVFVFLVNGGMPPAFLSGCEILMCVGRVYSIGCVMVVSLGIFVSGLWTLILSADQGRRPVKYTTWGNPGPILASGLLSSSLPLLLV